MPKIPPPVPHKRLRFTNLLIAAAGLGTMGLGVAYYFLDPGRLEWAPKCPLKMATGYDCPGCGSQRMIHALLHGDLAAALEANALMLILLPLIIVMAWVEWLKHRYPRLHRVMFSTPMALGIGAAIILWWGLRNFI